MVARASARWSRDSRERDRGKRFLRTAFRRTFLILLACGLAGLASPLVAGACSAPTPSAVGAAFELAGRGLLPASVPQLPATGAVREVPPSLLKAVGWVESGWRQFDARGKPLVAPDFGYGVMQITSGMPGAFGDLRGSIAPAVQSRIASDYVYNIAYGAQMLVDKWNSTPRIGSGDPTVLEDWYFALWAYNGWGWVNNPNNPRFSRVGTPRENPDTFPYQERVLYWVQHPPRDAAGNPLWKPTAVSLPALSVIGTAPHSFAPKKAHSEPVPALSAVYSETSSADAPPSGIVSLSVKIENTGTVAWPVTGTLSVSLTHHVMSAVGNPWTSLSPFSKGILSFGQGPVPLPEDILPGKSVTLSMPVKAPSNPGKYWIVWDLQQGADTWFSQQGVLPSATLLTVHAGTAAVPTPSATPTPGAVRTEDARFVADTSVPDGTVLAAGESFDKGWLLYNSGINAWGAGWSVRHISGRAFGLTSALLSATNHCRSLNFVARLHAPKSTGSYRGIWRIFDPSGQAIGDRFTLVVTVRGTPVRGTATPSPVPTPTGSNRATPTPTATPLG